MADIGTVPGISVENQQTSLANGGCPTASKEDPNSLSMTEERTISYGLVDSCQKEMVSESIETGDKMQTDSTSLVNVNSDMHQNVSNVSCSASSVATSQDNNSLTEKTSVSSDISTSCEHSDMTPPLGEPSIRIKMLARVAVSDAHFKHQQRGEPDLSVEEKIEIAQKLLDESKVKFLSRFSQYLEIEDLEYFKDLRHIYEVDFYCKQVVKQKSGTFHKNRVKNRRYEAMKQLISEGDYFSEEEMKFREPYLYDQMIGQFMTDEEIQAKVDKSDLRFSSILIHHMDLLDENARFAREKEKEESQMEEEEDSEEESELESDTEKAPEEDVSAADDHYSTKTIPEKEKQELKEEFMTIMQQRFLSGADKNFDYSKVDNNEQYDDLDVLNRDAQEKYFDDEDSASINSLDSMEL